MKKVFESKTNNVNQTARETIGVFKEATRAIEIKGEETSKAINEIEDLIKSGVDFDLRLSEPLSESVNSEKSNQFSLRVNPISEKLYTNKDVRIALHKKSLTPTEIKKV